MYNSNPFPRRKNIRAKFDDYSGGEYFITICTDERRHFFGEIFDDKMTYTPLGKFACQAFEEIPKHYSYALVSNFVVMPNHVHAIIEIYLPDGEPSVLPRVRSALEVVVGGFKQAVTRYARRNLIDFDWQTRYHDIIINSDHKRNMINEYIENNPALWGADRYNN